MVIATTPGLKLNSDRTAALKASHSTNAPFQLWDLVKYRDQTTGTPSIDILDQLCSGEISGAKLEWVRYRKPPA